MDHDEVQRISRLIEFNRMRLSQIADQVSRLEEVRQEHAAATHSLERLDEAGAETAMIPIGAGVQLRIDSSDIDGVIIDLGSGIMAERSASEARKILTKRDSELADLIGHLAQQHSETNELLAELISQLDPLHTKSQTTITSHPETDAADEGAGEDESDEDKPARRRRRRGFGAELTLDD